jgi:ornithine cyclodeaminase/alanine dehydrogenase-like protein (mu-crystallin family)
MLKFLWFLYLPGDNPTRTIHLLLNRRKNNMSYTSLLYLSRADVESVDLGMTEIIDLLEKAFREKGEGKVEMPPKPGIHTKPDAFIHAMPAYIPAMKSAGIKWVSGYPDNQQLDLPYISGLLVLNDVETGIPYAVMDCTWITAYRTGAASGLAAKYLARPGSETAGILACGVQGRTNLEALAALFPIKKVYAYDTVPEIQSRYIDDMKKKFDFDIVGVDEPDEAVMSSELVITSGPIVKHPHATIKKGWLQEGAFASAVDFDSYWSGEALSEADKISTDDLAQFRYYREAGYFVGTPEPFADLGEIVAGIKPGRENDRERNIAINLGLAMDDMAVAPEIYRRAKESGLGTLLTL